MEIFEQEGYAFLARWGHFLAGITWIGLLYYFNFVQVPSFAEMGADARSEALRRITWRALWWFRWGAALTVLSGILILAINEQLDDVDYFATPAGISILSGAILGIIMLSNVWLVIWPAQQVVIGSANAVAEGGEANPAAPASGRRALLASRANTLFSIPLLFFMGATSHLVSSSHFDIDLSSGTQIAWWIVFGVLAAAIELDALDVLGDSAPGWLKWPFETVNGVIVSGFVLAAVLYVVFEILFKA